MQTLNVLDALGKRGGELVKFLKSSLKDNDYELKILIDGPVQVEEIRKFLEPLNYSNFVLEDDDGNLYLETSKENPLPVQTGESPENSNKPALPVPDCRQTEPTCRQDGQTGPLLRPKNFQIQNGTGVLISCGNNGKYKKIFIQKILSSLVNSKIKPDVLALMNAAVREAAYNSSSCDYLKELEAAGVKILISQSCADYLGLTEAIGAGTAVDMSEIFEEIFSCERIVNL